MIFGNKYNHLIPDQNDVDKLNLDRIYISHTLRQLLQKRLRDVSLEENIQELEL